MGMAIFWGGLAGFANLLGALIVLRIQLSSKIIGYIMALGTGALIGAVAFELLADALELGSMYDIALGFLGGALIFTVADSIISRRGGKHRKRSSDQGEESSGLAIFIGTIMDAIPETAMIGLSLLSGQVSFALVLAIFISNIPEGLSSTTGLKSNQWLLDKENPYYVGFCIIDVHDECTRWLYTTWRSIGAYASASQRFCRWWYFSYGGFHNDARGL